MHTHSSRLVAGSLLVVLLVVAGCSGGAASSPTGPATPVGQPFDIRTAAVEPQACMDALMGGTLVRSAQSGLGIRSADGRVTAKEWPFRYGAAIEGGRVALFDETGKIVAREGDAITIGGGFGSQLWYACGPVTVTDAAS
jgi:hypothetical protein